MGREVTRTGCVGVGDRLGGRLRGRERPRVVWMTGSWKPFLFIASS